MVYLCHYTYFSVAQIQLNSTAHGNTVMLLSLLLRDEKNRNYGVTQAADSNRAKHQPSPRLLLSQQIHMPSVVQVLNGGHLCPKIILYYDLTTTPVSRHTT